MSNQFFRTPEVCLSSISINDSRIIRKLVVAIGDFVQGFAAENSNGTGRLAEILEGVTVVIFEFIAALGGGVSGHVA